MGKAFSIVALVDRIHLIGLHDVFVLPLQISKIGLHL